MVIDLPSETWFHSLGPTLAMTVTVPEPERCSNIPVPSPNISTDRFLSSPCSSTSSNEGYVRNALRRIYAPRMEKSAEVEIREPNMIVNNLECPVFPRFCYPELVKEAINASPGKRASLPEIYIYLYTQYSCFKPKDTYWMNPIRRLTSCKTGQIRRMDNELVIRPRRVFHCVVEHTDAPVLRRGDQELRLNFTAKKEKLDNDCFEELSNMPTVKKRAENFCGRSISPTDSAPNLDIGDDENNKTESAFDDNCDDLKIEDDSRKCVPLPSIDSLLPITGPNSYSSFRPGLHGILETFDYDNAIEPYCKDELKENPLLSSKSPIIGNELGLQEPSERIFPDPSVKRWCIIVRSHKRKHSPCSVPVEETVKQKIKRLIDADLSSAEVLHVDAEDIENNCESEMLSPIPYPSPSGTQSHDLREFSERSAISVNGSDAQNVDVIGIDDPFFTSASAVKKGRNQWDGTYASTDYPTEGATYYQSATVISITDSHVEYDSLSHSEVSGQQSSTGMVETPIYPTYEIVNEPSYICESHGNVSFEHYMETENIGTLYEKEGDIQMNDHNDGNLENEPTSLDYHVFIPSSHNCFQLVGGLPVLSIDDSDFECQLNEKAALEAIYRWMLGDFAGNGSV